MTATTFHLLRHAAHGHLGRVLTGRQAAVPLSPAGREEALALGRHMADAELDALYASPRLRARETAAIVSLETGVPYAVAGDLDEIDFGRWSGMTFEALSRDHEWRRWNAERDTAATPAGETMGDVAHRLMRLVGRLGRAHPGGAVALVSHSDVIKAGVCSLLGRPFTHVHTLEIGPASITTLKVDHRGGGRVVACNVRPMRHEAGVLA